MMSNSNYFNEDKIREYVREYPDQVFVNQNSVFNIDSYDIEDVGYTATIILDENIPNTSGSYTSHQECIAQCISLTRLYYEDAIEYTPTETMLNMVEELYTVAKDEKDEFTAVAIFLPFIQSVEHNSMLLDSLQENIFEKPYFEVLLEGPTQNRFWISKYGN